MATYNLNINNTKIGTMLIDYKLDYDIFFDCMAEGNGSVYYLINFQHMDDFDFFAIYKEVSRNGKPNYYLFDSEIKDICGPPEAILINDRSLDFSRYISFRQEIVNSYKEKSC